MYSLTAENTGNGPISDIELFLAFCSLSESLLVVHHISPNVSYKSNWSNEGHGEMIQLEVPASDIFGFGNDEYRLYVQTKTNNGAIFRTTYYLLDGGSLQKQATCRAPRALPKRTIRKSNYSAIERMTKKYSLDLSVG